jgi:hypothetical protein
MPEADHQPVDPGFDITQKLENNSHTRTKSPQRGNRYKPAPVRQTGAGGDWG